MAFLLGLFPNWAPLIIQMHAYRHKQTDALQYIEALRNTLDELSIHSALNAFTPWLGIYVNSVDILSWMLQKTLKNLYCPQMFWWSEQRVLNWREGGSFNCTGAEEGECRAKRTYFTFC
jgi:hypothetical protein